jgi:AraC-like DNA-binding protein
MMDATITGMDTVPARNDGETENDKKSRPADGVGAGLECADFFAANGISPPSTLFEEMSDTFYFAKNRAGKFVWGNRLLQEKHRLARAEDIIGKCDHDFFRRDIADRIRADDLAVMESGVPVKNKLEVIGGRNGVLTWLFTTKAPLRNKHGEVIGVEGFSRDAQRSQDIIEPFHVFRNAIEYLQAHFMDEIRIEHLARLSNMSLSTFERKFKQHFALTPKQYILRMRVHEACRLLPGSQSIERVALDTGFGGQSYFTLQFRSVVGITPKQYQRSVAAAGREAAQETG